VHINTINGRSIKTIIFLGFKIGVIYKSNAIYS
jgi:hypothetical protein